MMRFFKELGKAFFVGTLIFLVLGIIRYVLAGEINLTGPTLLKAFLYNQLYSVLLYMANAVFFINYQKKHGNRMLEKRLLAKGILAGLGITLVTLWFIRIITEVIIGGLGFTEFLRNESFIDYGPSMLVALVVISVFYIFYYYNHRQEAKVKEQKIIAKTASAQFDALKNQLDPHFLFNSLNVLTSLIEENPEAATRFTTSLSKVYRYVLEQKNKELITVEEELKFAKLYMSLIKMRFEDSIVFTVPETLSNPEAKVVPLSLQLLLENAVKHNQVMPSKKLHITIYEEGNNLIIKNNVQPKAVVKEGSGVGLQNIKQRYFLLTDQPVRIQQSDREFRVAIPLLTKASIALPTQETYISGKRLERAKKKVEELKGFYIHLTIYLIMVPVFIYINIRSTSFPWAIFPIGGWGFGVMGHASEVFGWNPFFGKDWEERKIRKFMEEDS
ncbi:2TM domain-containing protein [Aureitalea sp. L0-47]|uniref:2TM domain-containing protein n=1 Tax=Aureitalea sp. L0-47 TaxID=2816962 RepID=UPI002238C73B|nr:2TM domain-containing protein [Aureitalea sp. L0-47]MCW5519776.1 2TM domain-containing protein [Aureitalea sp. L0-47]